MTSLRLPHRDTTRAFRRRQRRAGWTDDAVRVRVHGGYEPAVIHARAGVPLRIVFRREESAACSDRVIFPTLGKSTTLPPYQDVTVEIVDIARALELRTPPGNPTIHE
jgi:plastocyanin domain-containing protein